MSFLWGAATSSHQIEGNNVHNDWWAWEAAGRTEGGARSGRATDHWNRYKEDLRLAADLGLNSYRFSVEWSRLEPEEGRWDDSALEWYEALVTECEKVGLLPMLTLHHFTSPKWFADRGGFTWSEAPARFAEYTRRVVRKLGGRIPLWCTINEPMVLVAGTYLGNIMPPGKFSPKLATDACHGLLASHVEAYKIIHSEVGPRQGPWKSHPLGVGIAHNMLDFMPDRSWHPLENIMASVLRNFYNRAWLDAVTGKKQHFGVPWFVPYAPQVASARGRMTADFIGVNYYTKAYVQWRPRAAAAERPPEMPIGISFARCKEVQSDLQWALHPLGLGKVLREAGRYGLPIYITENGIADHDDDLRPEFLRSHLAQMRAAKEAGLDIRGYYHWSLLDNFEWHKGFGPRFGLYQVNYDTFERKRTRSADLYAQLIKDYRSSAAGNSSSGSR